MNGYISHAIKLLNAHEEADESWIMVGDDGDNVLTTEDRVEWKGLNVAQVLCHAVTRCTVHFVLYELRRVWFCHTICLQIFIIWFMYSSCFMHPMFKTLSVFCASPDCKTNFPLWDNKVDAEGCLPTLNIKMSVIWLPVCNYGRQMRSKRKRSQGKWLIAAVLLQEPFLCHCIWQLILFPWCQWLSAFRFGRHHQ